MADSTKEFKIGDKVTYTNDNGVVFKGKIITGFCDWTDPLFNGRAFIDSDSPWYPVKLENLIIG